MFASLILPCLVESRLYFVDAAPTLSRNGSQTTVAWVSEPDGRGTISLILSCILTLSLCVWSALHLNVPPYNETSLQCFYRTTRWVFLAVTGPELVVWVAWRQLLSANALRDRILEIQRQVPAHKNEAKKSNAQGDTSTHSSIFHTLSAWNQLHGFYADMGGFVFSLEGFPHAKGHSRLTLTARGVALLAECGRLPELREEEIIDKSKTDQVAKLIACLQAIWMLGQISGRAAAGLPVTLLEINTMGHVFCALIMYVLWWRKPRQVNVPTELSGEWVASLGAYMYMSSKISGKRINRFGYMWSSWINPELSMLAYVPPKSFGHTSHDPMNNEHDDNITTLASALETSGVCNSTKKISGESSEDVTRSSSCNAEHVMNRDSRFGVLEMRPKELNKIEPKSRKILPTNLKDNASPSTLQLSRWNLAAEAIHCYSAVGNRVQARQYSTSEGPKTWFEPTVEELVVDKARNWPSEGLFRGVQGLIMGMVLWFASLAYGGIHAAAWNSYFPSTAEAIMWRASAVWIAAAGLLWISINWLAHQSKWVNDYWDRVVALEAHWTSYLWLGIVCGMCGLAYILARIFLVVEAFISIRQLQVAVYQTPTWTQLIPHL